MFKIGDKVKIKEEIKHSDCGILDIVLKRLKQQVLTIKGIVNTVVLFEETDYMFHITQLYLYQEKNKDVTEKYSKMLKVFSADFILLKNYNDFSIFDDFKKLIENQNIRFINDIELLEELVLLINKGKIKIIEIL